MNTNFLVLSGGRTGSHLLMSLITSHPQIFAEKSELFLPDNGAPFKLFPAWAPFSLTAPIKSFFRTIQSPAAVEREIEVLTRYVDKREKAILSEQLEVESYGFNFFISQLEGPHIWSPRVQVKDFLERLNGYKVIHLYRKNVVRQALSIIVKRLRKTMTPGEKLTIDVILLERMVNEWLLKEVGKENHITAEYNSLKVCYEDDLLDSGKHQETADKIFDYLEKDSHTIFTKQRRDGSASLESYIENADEVKSIITKYCAEAEETYYKC